MPDKSGTIYDVGAGTGVMGRLLNEQGYTNVDGMDASESFA